MVLASPVATSLFAASFLLLGRCSENSGSDGATGRPDATPDTQPPASVRNHRPAATAATPSRCRKPAEPAGRLAQLAGYFWMKRDGL